LQGVEGGIVEATSGQICSKVKHDYFYQIHFSFISKIALFIFKSAFV